MARRRRSTTALPRPDAPGAEVHDVVAGILREVRSRGDEALVRYTAELDKVDVSDGLRVSARTRSRRPAPTPIPVCCQALEVAFGRILAYHAHEGTPPGDLVDGGHHGRSPDPTGGAGRPLRSRWARALSVHRPHVRRAGPGGGRRAASPCACPPAADGRIDGATLCAASIAGVDEVYRVGGAQAIAAMAYGTPSVPAVDVIAGPGNAYVAEAKRQLSGVVGVASAFAGPSEIVVVAGPDAPAGRSPRSTWSCRPSTGPTGWPGW